MARGVNTQIDEVNIFVAAQDLTALTITATSTSTQNSSDITNYGMHKGGIFYVAFVSVLATSTIRINIQGKDPVSGGYLTLASLSIDGISVTTTGNAAQSILIYLGCATVAVNGSNVNLSVGIPLPKIFRVQASITVLATATSAVAMTVGMSKIV